MKKLLMIGAIALCGAMNAQTFGVKAGMNVSTLSGQDDFKAKVGLNGGVFMNAPLAESFSIQPELLYNSKGAKFDGGGSINADYISLPVMFQYNIAPKFYLEAGPEFSLLLSAKVKFDGESEDIKEDLNTFDFGAGIGAGYYITENIGVNARYVAGFSDVNKDNEGDSVKNGVFQVGLSYKFGK